MRALYVYCASDAWIQILPDRMNCILVLHCVFAFFSLTAFAKAL